MEASPATLSQRARALEAVGVQLPKNITSVICRRAAEEHMQLRHFEQVCKFLDTKFKTEFPDGVSSLMPASDSAGEEVPAEVRDFQCACLGACLTQLFMTSVVPKAKEPELAQMEKKNIVNATIKDISDFLTIWKASSLQSQLSEAKCLIVEDINKVANLVAATLQPHGLDSAACEQLENARTSLTKARSGPLYTAVAMSPVGVEICSRVSQLVQQHRSDLLLALDIDSAVNLAQGMRNFDAEVLLKQRDGGEWDIVIPGQAKFVEMTAKFLGFREKASEELLASSQDAVKLVSAKVDELYGALMSVVRAKYAKQFGEPLLRHMQIWAKGSLGADGPVLFEMIGQMGGFHPLAKVPLAKLLGKSLAESLEQEISVVKAYMSVLKDAFQVITKVLTEDVNEDLISEPQVAKLFGKLNDKEARKQLASTVPFLDKALDNLAGAMQLCLERWLAQVSSTFASFAGKLLEPEVTDDMVQGTLREEVLGVLEIHAEDSSETKQDLDWFFAFSSYFKYFGGSKVALKLDGPDGQTNVQVHAAFLCIVGALLRVAKYVMVCVNKLKECKGAKLWKDMLLATMQAKKESPIQWDTKTSRLLGCQFVFGKLASASKHFDEMLVQAVALTGNMDGVSAFYKALQKTMRESCGDIVAVMANDIESLVSSVKGFYTDLMTVQDAVAIFQSDPLDKQAISDLANDSNMQKLVHSGTRADRILSESASFLSDLKLVPVSDWMTEVTSSLIAATLVDVRDFQAVNGAVAQDNQSGKATMATVRYMNGSMTLAQALTRTLQPGETRLGLVSRCQNILEKKKILAEPALSKRAAALKGSTK